MSNYIIQGGKQGDDRLRILSEVMWPYTLPFLQQAGLREGMNCLDVGCGNGDVTRRIASLLHSAGEITGIDFDPSIIEIARNRTDASSHNLHFAVLNIETEDIGVDLYDFIYCRFILSHLQAPEVILQKLKRALRPEGVIAVEDVDFHGHFCHPPNRAFEQYVEMYEQTILQKGANPYIGPALLQILTEVGLQDIHLHVVLPTFYKGDGKEMALLTMKAIQQAVISAGLATEELVKGVIRDLSEFTLDEDSMMSLPRIFEVWGKK